MNIGLVEKIADAVMYEGYVLYPYRPSSIKNRQRFNFGVLYPRGYGSEPWEMKTECLLQGRVSSAIEVKVRFLQLVQRDDWQEGLPREVALPACPVESLTHRPALRRFTFGVSGQIVEGELELTASRLGEDLYRIALHIRNLALLRDADGTDRERVMLQSLAGVHNILQAVNGEFVSLLDPPELLRAAASACQNIGTWPVLAGEEGHRDLMLSAPIILYDYPQIAPESPGDLCDGTEIDEILALRILTLTDEEKAKVRNGDDRARRILERTETLPPEHFRKLHGALRGLAACKEAAG